MLGTRHHRDSAREDHAGAEIFPRRGAAAAGSDFYPSVTGEYPEDPQDTLTDPAIIDIKLIPDADTVRLVPWAREPTAQIIHDCEYANGTPVPMAPRQVLRRVLKLYEDKGWKPVLAPELEFYLVGATPIRIIRWSPRSGARAGRRRGGSPIRSTR